MTDLLLWRDSIFLFSATNNKRHFAVWHHIQSLPLSSRPAGGSAPGTSVRVPPFPPDFYWVDTV